MIPRLPKGFTHPMAIGEGSFSSVIRARQTSLDRWVAVKILKEKDPDKRKEQLQEARVQAGIQSNCVPEVFDVFEWRKQIFIVMQWVRGVRLSTLLKKDLSPEERNWLTDKIIHAVADIHRHGYAHRDLKPENILISPKKGIFLIDFGLSKNIEDNFGTMTEVVKGTPAYMAPELWSGTKNVDYFRTDIFALGKIFKWLYHTLPQPEILDNLVAEDPENRPGKGPELLSLWLLACGDLPQAAALEYSNGEISSQRHSKKLYNAAAKLILAHRIDEAYWLLVECLEEDPNNGEAISLMETLSAKKESNQKQKLLMPVYALIAVAVMAFIYFFGLQKGRETKQISLSYADNKITKALLLPTTGNKSYIKRLIPLKSANPQTKSLSATLTAECPSGGVLVLNDRHLNKNELKTGTQVPYGSHLLKWIDDDGNVLWREKIRLLPFQTKRIKLPGWAGIQP
ncbi:MAG: serine/threonine protein kinase [Fibrobacteria bacterium]|nr:serine/threonine protein kinase [Fibrobacteria bacterium]